MHVLVVVLVRIRSNGCQSMLQIQSQLSSMLQVATGLVFRPRSKGAYRGGGGEARGQQKQSNDPGNNQHILNTPTIGRR